MAFISYSHADNRQESRKWADWLHHALETYEIPSELIGQKNLRGGTIPSQIYPVFQDEKELSANHSLETALQTNLQNSENLIYLSSPKSASSVYVQNELVYYKQIGNADRIIALILSGEPEYGDTSSPNQCFPDALRYGVDSAGNIQKNEKQEPLAADVRLPNSMEEGFTSPEAYRRYLTEQKAESKVEIDKKVNEYKERLELAKLKIIAGVLNVPLGELTKRDKAYQLEKIKQKNSRIKKIAAGIGALAVLAVLMGIMAWNQKNKALNTLAFSLFSSGENKVQNGENSDGAAYIAAATRYGNKNAEIFGQSILTSISSDYRVPKMANAYQIAYSPDSKWLLYTTNISENKYVPQIFNLETRKAGNMQKEFAVSTYSPIKIDPHNNGYYIDDKKHLIKWNFKTNVAQIVKSDDWEFNQVNYFDVSPDGRFAICHLTDNTQSLIDLLNNRPIKLGIKRAADLNTGYPTYIFSDNSESLAQINYYSFGNIPTEIKIFDLTNPSQPEKTFSYQMKGPSLQFDQSGKKMIINSDKDIFAFDMRSDNQPRLLRSENYIKGFLNPDGKTVTVNGIGSELVDFSTGKSLKKFETPISMSRIIPQFDNGTVHVSPDYTQDLVVVNNQATMKSFVTKPLLYNQFVAKKGLKDIICSDESNVLMSYKYSPKIEMWNSDTNQLNSNFIDNKEIPEFFDVLKNKPLLYTISASKNVKFYHTETGKQQGKTIQLHPSNAAFVMMDKEEKYFAGRLDKHTIGIFNIESGKTENKITDPKISKYLLSRDFSKIFILKNDQSWQLKDVKSGKIYLKGNKPVTGVNFSGDSKNLMIIYGDANVEIIDMNSLESVIKLKSIFNATGDFSDDGEYFAISEDVNLVKIWSVKQRKPIGESIPVTKFATFFRFSEDGSKIFVTDNAKNEAIQHQINIFDTQTGKNVTVPFAISRIQKTDVFPKEKRVLTVNFDTGTAPIVSIWEVPGQLKISPDKLADNLEKYFGKKYDLETGTISSFSETLKSKDWFFQDPYSRTITPNSKFTTMDKVKEYLPIKNMKQVEILTNNYIYHPYTRAVLAFHYAQAPETAYIAHNLYKITNIQKGKIKDAKVKSEVEKLLDLTAKKIYLQK